MADNFSTLVVNDLDSIQFIGGTEQILSFTVVDSAGSEVDLTTATTTVVFSPYGQNNYAAMTITGSVALATPNTFTATLTGSSTQLLSGKYTMQPCITDIGGTEYRPSQGIVLITGRNATV